MPIQLAARDGRDRFSLTRQRRACLLAAASMLFLAPMGPTLAQTTAAPAQARPATRSFDIPAQPLSSAVAVFSRQSGLQVTLASATARGVSARAVKGSMTAEQALSQMLAGTGVQFRLSGGTVVIGQTSSAATPIAADDGSIALDPVTVAADAGGGYAGYQGAPDWLYSTPAAISVMNRAAMQEVMPRDASDLFDGMAGVNVASPPQNPGISVNVRGLQDQNRVTMSIDGARQNYQQSGHNSTSYAYVDPLLLREVEVEKNATVGVGAGGTHGGVVNFRTLNATDLIQPGRNWGGEIDVTTGTNEYQFYGLAAVAGRMGKVDATFAVTNKELGAYSVGTNGTLSPSVSAQYLQDQSAVFTGGTLWSGLAKFGWDITDEQRLELGLVAYDTEFTTSTSEGGYVNNNHVRNLTGTLTYTYQPDNALIDLKAQIWANQTENQQYRTARTTYGAFDVDYKLNTYGGSITNTSAFKVPYGNLSLFYGAEGFFDDANTSSFNYDSDDTLTNWWYSGTNPSGERWMVTPFGKATFTHGGWLEISAGGRYDYYNLSGTSTVNAGTEQVLVTPSVCLLWLRGVCRRWSTAVYATYQLTEDVDIQQSGGHFSPEATVAVTPFNGLQVYGKYSGGYRPPTLSESVLGGEHIGGIFAYIPNPYLQPETSQNWEIGVNMMFDNVLRSGDTFRLKAAYFDRTIENYIALVTNSLLIPGTSTVVGGYQAVNLLGESKLKGIEIEANYDAGDYYAGASYTYINSDYSNNYFVNTDGYTSYTETGVYLIFVAPEQKLALDIGMRQFDRRWVIGTKITHVVSSEQLGLNALSYAPTTYTVWDVYSSFKINEKASFRVAVMNLTDVAYVDALNAADFPAPGRTATVSLNLKF